MTLTGWDRVALKDFCLKIGSGSTPRGGDSVYVDEGTTLVRSQNVYNGEFAFEGLAYLADREADALRGVTVKSGDVLLNITGDSVARCCVAPESVLPARVNQHVAIIRPRPDEFIARFLAYYLISPFMQETMLSMAGGGGTRKALTKDMIERFTVPKPALDCQERIVAVLAGYDDLIDNNRRRIKLLEDSVRLLFEEWFVRLRPLGGGSRSQDGSLPAGWRWGRCTDVVAVNPKVRTAKDTELWYVPMSALSQTGMTVDKADFERRTEHTAVKFERGDTLFARITPCLENGKTGYVYFLDEGQIACGSTEFVVLRGKQVSSYFTYCLARTQTFRDSAIRSMIGSSGRQRVQPSAFEKFELAIPPENVLVQFDEVAADCFEQVANLASQNERLVRARDLLLPRLMSGELTV